MANRAVQPLGDEVMTGLNGDEGTEALAEKEHRPDPQNPANEEQHETGVAHGVAVEDEDIPPVREGEQPRQQYGADDRR